MAEPVKTTVFVGSSAESFEVAKLVAEDLEADCEVTNWREVIPIGQSTLHGLIEAADQFDFAIMVLAGEDLTESRGDTLNSPRDNVV